MAEHVHAVLRLDNGDYKCIWAGCREVIPASEFRAIKGWWAA